MRRALGDNALSAAFGVLFLATLVAQSLVGWRSEGHHATAHGEPVQGYLRYVASSSFGRAVLENWQSEYLQFAAFILATVWLVQRGSPESKEPGEAGLGAAGRASGRAGRLRRVAYEWSLLLVMAGLFVLSWVGHSLAGRSAYNEEAILHGEARISWSGFVTSAEFWEQTLQNWQSEFLAVGSFAIFTVFLRQRGSPESKPVDAPDEASADAA